MGTKIEEPEIDWEKLEARDRMMKYFHYGHLKPELREVSKMYFELACSLLDEPEGPERTVALRKLLESKDCAVRNRLPKPEQE
jgi:hypothetical protein